MNQLSKFGSNGNLRRYTTGPLAVVYNDHTKVSMTVGGEGGGGGGGGGGDGTPPSTPP